MQRKTVFLYTSGCDQDEVVFPLLKNAGIPFSHFLAHEKTLYVLYDEIYYYGVDEIKAFVEACKQRLCGAIKRIVRDWISEASKIKHGNFHVINIMECPWCGRGMLEFNHDHNQWRCLYHDCHFTFPEDIKVPSPRQLEIYLENEELRRLIKILEG